MKLAAVAAAAAVLLLAGCAHAPTSGTVHNVQDNPAYTTIVCASYNSKGGCSVYIPQNYPETWELDVYASDDDHGWVDVDQRTYLSCHVGDYYNRGVCR